MLLLVICACSSSKKIKSGTQTEYPPIADNFTDGGTIINKSDCWTCHRKFEKSIGPAFSAIAKKYQFASETTKNKLSEKIRSGGSGQWGKVPMTPHPSLSGANADSIVSYILLKYN